MLHRMLIPWSCYSCIVKWDRTEEECGWYKCGARTQYALRLITKEEEDPYLVTDLIHTGGNSKKELEDRSVLPILLDRTSV